MKALVMKKSVAILLILSILLACVSVLPIFRRGLTARAAASEVEATVLLNRDFDDGKELGNGFHDVVANSPDTDSITLGEYADGNKYAKIQKNSKRDAFLNIELSAHLERLKKLGGYLVASYEVTSAVSPDDIGGIISYLRGVQTSDGTQPLFLTSDGYLCAGENQASSRITMNKDTRYTLGVVVTYTGGADTVGITLFVNGSRLHSNTGIPIDKVAWLRIGLPGTGSVKTAEIGVDNIKVFTLSGSKAGEKAALDRATDDPALSQGNGGLLYNKYGDDIVDLDGADAMYLKINANRALRRSGERITLPPPVEIDGVTYIPIAAVADYLGLDMEISGNTVRVGESYLFSVGSSDYTHDGVAAAPLTRKVLSVGGEYPVFSIDSVGALGICASRVSCGLIALSGEEDRISDEDTSYSAQMSIMKRFLFDHIDTDGESKVSAITAADVPDAHPYIIADAERFEYLSRVYRGEIDEPVLQHYLTVLADRGAAAYNTVTSRGISSYVNPFGTQNNGSDIGGRQEESGSYNGLIMNMAFAYQITRDEKYVKTTYDLAVQMGSWNHWNPGHYLDVANAAYAYAVAYDWMYNAWTDAGYDVSAITRIIFTHGVLPGYFSAKDKICPWPNGKIQTISWNMNENNWNAVCASGMSAAALAIINELTDVNLGEVTITPVTVGGTVPSWAPKTTDGVTITAGSSYPISRFGSVSTNGFTTYQDYATYLINQVMYGLELHGLAQYIPDGSYIEGNGYWGYGTNNLFETAATVISATGNDWGLMDGWGLDNTCYYALNCMSGDFQSFNYHDSKAIGPMDTCMFAFVAEAVGDPNLAGIRRMMLDRGAGTVSIFDAVYYSDTTEYTLPDLQYHMVGIDGYVVRDSWDPGSVYAAYLGNLNKTSHSQIDSGSFVYYSNGTRWFLDLDTYDYNAYDFGGKHRYSYYKMSAEGNNTLFLTSRQGAIPFGQAQNGFGKIEKTGSNGNGAFSVMNQDGVYGVYARSAYRGLLMTNSRRTVVIQDEVEFYDAESAVWVAHTQQEIIVSTDGRTAYLYNGDTVLRVTLVTDGEESESLKFEAMEVLDDADDFDVHSSNPENTFFLDATVSSTFSAHMGGVDLNTKTESHNDNAIENTRKLVVRCENTKKIKMAVVIEELAFGEQQRVGYSWVDMADWTPTSDGDKDDVILSENDFDGTRVGDIELSDGSITGCISSINCNSAFTAEVTDPTEGGASVLFKSIPSKVTHGSAGNSYITLELDVTSYTEYPEGMLIGVRSNNGVLASVSLAECGANLIGRWTRLSLVLDTVNRRMYVYSDGSLVAAKDYSATAGYENLALLFLIPKGTAEKGESLTVDNVLVRRIAADGTAGTELSTVLSDSSLLFSDWSFSANGTRRISAPLAAVGSGEYTEGVGSYGSDGDTPTVNLEAKLYYSIPELEAAIKRGDTVTILSSLPSHRLNIGTECTVINRGFDVTVVSDTLMGFVSPSDPCVTEYRQGSVTVTLITDSGSISYQAFSSSIADLDTHFGGVAEGAVCIGNELYVTDRISRDPEGRLSSPRDLVITDANNTFYLVSAPFQGAFFAKNGSSYVLGYTADELANAFTAGYEFITLCKDIEVAASTSPSKAIVLNLNGNNLKFTGTAGHMIISYSDVTVNGPGTLTETTSRTMFMTVSGNLEMNGLTIESNGTFLDHRSPLATFNNCVINSSSGTPMSVINRNNAYRHNPTLILDGCGINSPKSCVINLHFSARAEIKGGTVINALQLVCLMNDSGYGGTVTPTSDTIGGMMVTVGDCVLNVSNILIIPSATLNQATFGDFRDTLLSRFTFNGIASIPDGSILTGAAMIKESIYEYTVSLGSAAIARQNSSLYPRAIAPAGRYARVTWIAGDKAEDTEIWVEGSLPMANDAAIANLAAMESGELRGYYQITAVSPEESKAGRKTITAAALADVGLLMNMTLHRGFDLNLYIKASTQVGGIYLDGVAVDEKSKLTVDGIEYYMVTLKDIAPAEAGKTHTLTVEVGDGLVSYRFSVLSYCRRVLEDDSFSEDVHTLVANIARYSVTSYRYFGNTDSDEYTEAEALVNNYKHKVRCAAPERKDSDVSAVTDALSGVSIKADSLPRFRFFLNPDYSGRVFLTYSYTSYNADDGKYVTVRRTESFTVENGIYTDPTYASRKYIEIGVNACDLADGITITTDGGTAVYDLGCYYTFGATELNSELSLLLNALLAYAQAARIYKGSDSHIAYS